MKSLMVALGSLALLIVSSTALGKPYRPIVVAVIDTGIDSSLMDKSYICKDISRDFTGRGLNDVHGHGTHISGIIHQYVTGAIIPHSPSKVDLERFSKANATYCQMILKYYAESAPGSVNLANMIKALDYAISMHVDYINISGGGPESNSQEKALIEKALNMGIKVVVAAGNDHHDISFEQFKYYPASYDKRIIIVGNLSDNNSRSPSSNYGPKVNTWEHGEGVYSTIPGNKYGRMTGTSQATAIKTGKLIHEVLSH